MTSGIPLTYLILAALSLVATPSYPQRWKPGLDTYSWGLGIVSMAGGANRSEIINFSSDTLAIYDSPGGQRLGKLFPDTRMNRYYQISFSYDTAGRIPIMVDPADTREINYEGVCFKYYDTSLGYVEILRHTLHGKGNGWARVSELKSIGMEPIEWVEFILSMKGRSFFKMITGGLNVRVAPKVESMIVTTLVDRSRSIYLGGQRQGDWLNVRISDRYIGLGDDTSGVNWTHGWIKAVSDRGVPNIWFATRGC